MGSLNIGTTKDALERYGEFGPLYGCYKPSTGSSRPTAHCREDWAQELIDSLFPENDRQEWEVRNIEDMPEPEGGWILNSRDQNALYFCRWEESESAYRKETGQSH